MKIEASDQRSRSGYIQASVNYDHHGAAPAGPWIQLVHMSKTYELTAVQLPWFLGRCEADCGPAAPDAVGGQLLRTIISIISATGRDGASTEVHMTQVNVMFPCIVDM